MNKIFFWSFSVALAGLLFGFDTIVISGADQKLQELWNTSDVFHGFVVMASALWGTVIGAVTGGIPTNKFGRKNMLIAIGVLYFVSAVGAALANDPITFAFFRFIGGLGIGASTIAAPGYISEIAARKKRSARGHVSVEHRAWHTYRLPLQLSFAKCGRRCVEMDDWRGSISICDLFCCGTVYPEQSALVGDERKNGRSRKNFESNRPRR